MTLTLSDRVQSIRPSATLEIDALGKRLKASGKPVISFAAGEPDFPTPGFIVEAARAAALDPTMHKYTPAPGLPALREAVARRTNLDQGLISPDESASEASSIPDAQLASSIPDAQLRRAAPIRADQVLITNGGKSAVFETLAALLNPGDAALVPAPSWLTYEELVRYHGAEPLKVAASKANSFKITPESLEESWDPRAKVLLLNSPTNPTGAVYSSAELRAIADFAIAKDIWVVSDEIYEYLIYGELLEARERDGFETAPHILEVAPEIQDRLVIINGVAKSWAMTGWRVGWAIGPDQFISGAKKLQSHLCSNVSNVAQAAALAAVEGSREAVFEMRAAFAKRSALITALLREIDLFETIEPQGAFYSFTDVSAALGRPLGPRGVEAQNATELAKLLLEEINVACVPMDAFGIENHLRFSYALGEAEITEGIGRIAQFLGAARE